MSLTDFRQISRFSSALMSSEAILRPDILVIGERSYRINPSSLPGLESRDQHQDEVYREEDESDYYRQTDANDDEPNCKLTFPRTTTETVEPVKQGNLFSID